MKAPTVNFKQRNKMKGKGGSVNASRAKHIVRENAKRVSKFCVNKCSAEIEIKKPKIFYFYRNLWLKSKMSNNRSSKSIALKRSLIMRKQAAAVHWIDLNRKNAHNRFKYILYKYLEIMFYYKINKFFIRHTFV